MSVSVSGLDEATFNQPENYAANIVDLENILFLTIKSSGVAVEKVTVLSVSFLARRLSAAASRRLSATLVDFIVTTNTASEPLTSIADQMTTALTDNLVSNLKASPNPLLRATTGVSVQAILLPSMAPTPAPTAAPTVSLLSYWPYAASAGGTLVLGIVVVILHRRGVFRKKTKIAAGDEEMDIYWNKKLGGGDDDDENTVLSEFTQDSGQTLRKKKKPPSSSNKPVSAVAKKPPKPKLTKLERMWRRAGVVETASNKIVPMDAYRDDAIDDDSAFHIFLAVSPDLPPRRKPVRKQPKAETCRFHYDGKPQNAYLRGSSRRRCAEARRKDADGVTLQPYCDRHCSFKHRKLDAMRGVPAGAGAGAGELDSVAPGSYYNDLGTIDDDSSADESLMSHTLGGMDDDGSVVSDMSEFEEPLNPPKKPLVTVRGALVGRVKEIVVQTKG